MSRNLPSVLWADIASRLNKPNVASLRLVSTEARRGANNEFQKYRKHKALKTAFAAARDVTIRPLVAALRQEPPENDQHLMLAPPNRRVQTNIMLGRHTVWVVFAPREVIVAWWRSRADGGTVPVGIITFAPNGSPSTFDYPDTRQMGRGAATVVRLVKVATKRVFGG